jgi:osmotically-inducible protein OsmY
MTENQKADTTTEVVNALLSHPHSGTAVIEIEEKDGKVTLRGLVESEDVRQRLERTASIQNGVVSVDNQLTTNPEESNFFD